MKSFLIRDFLLILIIFITALLRIYKLGSNPPGLNWDEAAFGYNSYSILTTARDEYGKFLPLTLQSFGDYKAPLYVYLAVPSVAVLGLNEFSVRLPSAVFGTLTVLVAYFLAQRCFKNKRIALFSAFFLAISPWHLQFSRGAFEANVMLFFDVLGLTLFLHSFKNYKLLVASAISFGLAFNSYHGAKIWVPLFILAIGFFFRKELLKLKLKLFFPLVILTLFILPTVIDFHKITTRGRTVSILGKKDAPITLIKGYLSQFSPNFLFIAGDSIGRHAVSGMGQIYVFQLPFILAGLFFLIKDKKREARLLLVWLVLSPLPAALATPTPHALRGLTVLPLWSILSALGLSIFLSLKIKKTLFIVSGIFILSIFSYNLLTYFHLYYKHYPKEKAPDWQDGYREMINFVNQVKDDYEVIAITNYYGHPYIYTLFYTKYDPRIYQLESQDKSKFSKFEFFGSNWEKKTTREALVVRPYWQIPIPAPKYLKFIYSGNGDLVFRISEE